MAVRVKHKWQLSNVCLDSLFQERSVVIMALCAHAQRVEYLFLPVSI